MIEHTPQCVHFKGEDEDTPLHCAAMYNHTEAAETLLNNHADAKAE